MKGWKEKTKEEEKVQHKRQWIQGGNKNEGVERDRVQHVKIERKESLE